MRLGDNGTVSLVDGEGGEARVLTANVAAGDGVVHVIDSVLLPVSLKSLAPPGAPVPAPEAAPASGAASVAASAAALAASLLAAALLA